jgi:hypothetical protein
LGERFDGGQVRRVLDLDGERRLAVPVSSGERFPLDVPAVGGHDGPADRRTELLAPELLDVREPVPFGFVLEDASSAVFDVGARSLAAAAGCGRRRDAGQDARPTCCLQHVSSTHTIEELIYPHKYS